LFHEKKIGHFFALQQQVKKRNILLQIHGFKKQFTKEMREILVFEEMSSLGLSSLLGDSLSPICYYLEKTLDGFKKLVINKC
jgi:hypothetical protein